MINELLNFKWSSRNSPIINYSEKYLMVGYFLLDYSDPVFCASMIQRAEDILEEDELEVFIGYNAGLLTVSKKGVVFETYGHDPGAETIEMPYDDFIYLIKSWHAFIVAGFDNDTY